MAVDDTLRALANPTRRAMLELVWDAERSSSEIAEAVGATRPATSQHLKVLRDAGLVHVRADGNQRLYRVDTERRSEEHTSELQSRPHLVCRLLLEKKK